MKQYKYVIIDGCILIGACVAIVLFLNFVVFAKLKKNSGGDSLVTMIQQDNVDRVKEVLGEDTFNKMKENKPATFDEYKKMRVTKTDDFGRTALMWLAYANNLDTKITSESDLKRVTMIDELLKAGAEINAADKDGWTALMWASWSGLNTVVVTLIEKGADTKIVDKNGNTALMIAAQMGHVNIVKLLLEKGADKTAVNAKNKTAKNCAEEISVKYPKKADAYKEIISML